MMPFIIDINIGFQTSIFVYIFKLMLEFTTFIPEFLTLFLFFKNTIIWKFIMHILYLQVKLRILGVSFIF